MACEICNNLLGHILGSMNVLRFILYYKQSYNKLLTYIIPPSFELFPLVKFQWADYGVTEHGSVYGS